MNHPHSAPGDPRSSQETVSQTTFGKLLASDPGLASRYEKNVTDLRAAANKELLAVEQSELLTAENLTTTINYGIYQEDKA